jgi:hypothetical protein
MMIVVETHPKVGGKEEVIRERRQVQTNGFGPDELSIRTSGDLVNDGVNHYITIERQTTKGGLRV